MLPQENTDITEEEKVSTTNIEIFSYSQSNERKPMLETTFNFMTGNCIESNEKDLGLQTKLKFVAGTTISETQHDFENVDNSMMEIDVEKDSIISSHETFDHLDENSLNIETNFMGNEDSDDSHTVFSLF